jgi:CRISPR-associated protein Csm5
MTPKMVKKSPIRFTAPVLHWRWIGSADCQISEVSQISEIYETQEKTMPVYDYKTYRLKITTLTPLHIGNGQFLFRDYDYASREGCTWRFDENAMLEEKIDDPKMAEILAKQKPVDLLNASDYQRESKLFRYILPGESTVQDGKVREYIKNVYDQPYIPGTAVKGALRTAIGWHEWKQEEPYPQLGGKREFAGQKFERDIFGRKPYQGSGSDVNYDLMRAMIVSDSRPLDNKTLQLINVAVFRHPERFDNIDKRVSSLEVATINTTFEMDLKIDTALFSDWARKLGFGAPERLTEWVQVCKAHTRQRLETEIAYYQRQKSAKVGSALALYQRWAELDKDADENAFLMQLGWGTGWDGKTFGSRLKADEDFMQNAISVFKLGRNHTYPTADDFPMSRRLPQKNANAPLGYPLGWVLVTVQPGNEPETNQTDWQKRMLESVSANASVRPIEVFARPAKKPLTVSFTTTPEPGARFEGKVIDIVGSEIMLEIPGLEDSEDYAVIDLGGLPIKRPRADDKVTCEVLRVKQEKNYWRVECALG